MYRYLVFKTIVILVGGAASLVKESPSLCSMESPMAEGGVANPHGVNPPGCWKPNTANDGTRESSIHLQQLSDADELHSDEFQIQAARKQGGLELSGPKTREIKENPTAGMVSNYSQAILQPFEPLF